MQIRVFATGVNLFGALALLVAGSACATSGPLSAVPPEGSLEARHRWRCGEGAAVGSPLEDASRSDGRAAATVATRLYRSLIAPTLGSRCRMFPSDSQLFDLRAQRHGAIRAAYLGLGGVLSEIAATPETFRATIVDERLRWLADGPSEAACPDSPPLPSPLPRWAATVDVMLPVAADPAPSTHSEVSACEDDGGVSDRLRAEFRAGRYLDVHGAAATLTLLCPNASARTRWQLLDGLALMKLDESGRALGLFAHARDEIARDPVGAAAGSLLLAWAYWRLRDVESLRIAQDRLPDAARLRLSLLDAATQPAGASFSGMLEGSDVWRARDDLRAARERYEEARHLKRPWLGGLLSAVLPGAGQAYAGSAAAAAAAFVLNAVFISGTVELARHGLYATAVAAGMTASFFYVGNVLSAIELATRRNARASEAPFEALERMLVPEAHP